MEQADQTLHDFVLNLLSDTQALSAFEQDPAAMLDHAGLSDISAADVQEVIPLVIDFVPTHADALDSIMSQLPIDSVDTGQLGAIQQLQFVTQALGGIPAFSAAGAFGDDSGLASGNWHLESDGSGVSGAALFTTPLGDAGGTMGGDLQHGVTGQVWTMLGDGEPNASVALPGLDALSNLPGLGGGLPSGFSAMSDVTDTLDGHLSSVTGALTENATNTANLMAGVADFAAGGLTDPAQLTSALSDPGAALSALTGTAEAFTNAGAATLPAPANAIAGDAVQTVSGATQGVVSEVTSHLPAAGLPGVGDLGHLSALDPTHALSSVQGVVSDVTGSLTSQLPTGALGNLGDLSHVVDPTHALSTVTGVVGEVTGGVTQSPVSDVTSTTGAGNLLGSLDHNDVGSDLSHVTSDLHLPSLF